MVTIIDYGAGNLRSMQNALEELKVEAVVTQKPQDLKTAEKIVFPGVGSFGQVMQNLRALQLDGALREAIASGTPFLGVCLGLQILFEESEESPGVKGLGIFKGKAVKFRKGKVPQIGWNEILPSKQGALKKGYAYFVNSYYVVPEDSEIVAAKTNYGIEFVSAIQRGAVTATQFHPEKSSVYGLAFLRRWLDAN
jgi:imidazole glycerol phosphate synthase glutamine amidotransferase subunit